jgi:hypothetical protein
MEFNMVPSKERLTKLTLNSYHDAHPYPAGDCKLLERKLDQTPRSAVESQRFSKGEKN